MVAFKTSRCGTSSAEMARSGLQVLTVLRDEHKAGVGPIVNAFRIRIAHAQAEMVTRALVKVDEQAVPFRVPSGSSLK